MGFEIGQHIYTAKFSGRLQGFTTVGQTPKIPGSVARELEKHALTGVSQSRLKQDSFPIFRFFPLTSAPGQWALSRTSFLVDKRGVVPLTHSLILEQSLLQESRFDIGYLRSQFSFTNEFLDKTVVDLPGVPVTPGYVQTFGPLWETLLRRHSRTEAGALVVQLLEVIESKRKVVFEQTTFAGPEDALDYVVSAIRILPIFYRLQASFIVNAHCVEGDYLITLLTPGERNRSWFSRSTPFGCATSTQSTEHTWQSFIAGVDQPVNEEGWKAWEDFSVSFRFAPAAATLDCLFSFWHVLQNAPVSDYPARFEDIWNSRSSMGVSEYEFAQLLIRHLEERTAFVLKQGVCEPFLLCYDFLIKSLDASAAGALLQLAVTALIQRGAPAIALLLLRRHLEIAITGMSDSSVLTSVVLASSDSERRSLVSAWWKRSVEMGSFSSLGTLAAALQGEIDESLLVKELLFIRSALKDLGSGPPRNSLPIWHLREHCRFLEEYQTSLPPSGLRCAVELALELFESYLVAQPAVPREHVRRLFVPRFDEMCAKLDPSLRALFYIVISAFIRGAGPRVSNMARGLVVAWTYLQRDDSEGGNVLYAELCQWIARFLGCPDSHMRILRSTWTADRFAREFGNFYLDYHEIVLQVALAARNDSSRIKLFFSYFHQCLPRSLETFLGQLETNLHISGATELDRNVWREGRRPS